MISAMPGQRLLGRGEAAARAVDVLLHRLNPAISRIRTSRRAARRTDKAMAGLVENVLGESCRAETQQAIRYEGDAAFAESFRLLGAGRPARRCSPRRTCLPARPNSPSTSMSTRLQKKLGLPAK
jgi:hypothetical protein